MIRGRRRIGKTRLAEEFSKDFKKTYSFTALPPDEKVTSKMQRQEFIRQMRSQKIPRVGTEYWGDLLTDLANACKKGHI